MENIGRRFCKYFSR